MTSLIRSAPSRRNLDSWSLILLLLLGQAPLQGFQHLVHSHAETLDAPAILRRLQGIILSGEVHGQLHLLSLKPVDDRGQVALAQRCESRGAVLAEVLDQLLR